MTEPKLSKLELQIMDALWTRGSASIREIQEAFPEKDRPAYTTIQTTVYRMETKKAVKRVRKVGNFHIFEPAVSRNAAQRRLIDAGKLTLEDVKDAEKLLRQMEKKEKSK